MKIGLVRHFKVKCKPKQKWLYLRQFYEWIEAYDNSEILYPNNFGYNDSWDICFSSDLRRAKLTAEFIFDGLIIKTKDLREVDIIELKNIGIKMHYIILLIINRVLWFISGKLQDKNIQHTIARAKNFLDIIETSEYSKVLIVSHGLFMKFLDKELKQRKYRGKMELIPKNGKIIIYDK